MKRLHERPALVLAPQRFLEVFDAAFFLRVALRRVVFFREAARLVDLFTAFFFVLFFVFALLALRIDDPPLIGSYQTTGDRKPCQEKNVK